MPFTVRGSAKITWKPAYTLVLASVDGISLTGDGQAHPLTATLTQTSGGAAVPNKRIRLTANPARSGNGVVAWTDANGVARFQVSDTYSELVIYLATFVSVTPIDSNFVNITWSGTSAPPATPAFNRTYIPYQTWRDSQACGPHTSIDLTQPIANPTSLSLGSATDSNVNFWSACPNFAAWATGSLPTVAEFNKIILDNGFVFGDPFGPFLYSYDTPA